MANGDIALTVPKSVAAAALSDVHIGLLPVPYITFVFLESGVGSAGHGVYITNAVVTGFDYGIVTPGAFTDGISRAQSNYLTTILGVLFIGNANTLAQRKTATVQRLITDGVITVAGTVG